MYCSWPLCAWTHIQVNTFLHMYYIFMKLFFLLWEHSFTNTYSLPSHGHYHIHLARRYPLLPVPLTPQPALVPRWAFMSSSLCEWEAVLATASIAGVKPGHTWTPTEAVTGDHIWTGFDLSHYTWFVCFHHFYALLTCMHAHHIHIHSQSSSEVGFHTRVQFRRWFLLELLSYRACCKSPTVAIESHGGAMGMEGSRLLQQLNNA